MKNIIFIDGGHHGMRFMSKCKEEDTAENGYQLWRYYFLNSIFHYIENFDAQEVIIATDSKNNWRRKIFPYYKGDRKFKRKVQEQDTWFTFQKYYEIFTEFLTSISKNLPLKVITIDGTESDDIIGILVSSEQLKNYQKIIITNDNDYIQLLAQPNTKLYNSISKGFMTHDNPKRALLIKTLTGDKGDFVPSIMDRHMFKPEFIQYCLNEKIDENEHNLLIRLENNENLLLDLTLKFQDKYGIKPSKVFIFTEKKAEELLETGKMKEFLAEKNLTKKFLRNNSLINLTDQPKEVKEIILKTYENYEMNASIKQFFNFSMEQGFTEIINDQQRFVNILRPLYANS